MPASAAPAKTVGHGPSTDLQLLCGAQKRAASAFAQQVHTLKQLHHVRLSTADLAAFQSVRFTTLRLHILVSSPTLSRWYTA